jgi:hypothetical protein
MIADNVWHVELGILSGHVCGGYGYKVSWLSQVIHNDPYRVASTWGARQPHNEVYADVFPYSASLKWSAMTLRHVSHSDTYFTISLFNLIHQKLFFNSWYILLVSGWIEYLQQWASSMILRRSLKFFGTTRRSLNHRIPSASYRKHYASPNFNLLRRCPIPTSIFWAAMTSFLIVGMRAMLFKLSCGTTRRLGSFGSKQGG